MEIHVEPPALQNQSPYGDSHGFEPAEPVLPSQGQEPTVLLAPSALPEDMNHQALGDVTIPSNQDVQADGSMVTPGCTGGHAPIRQLQEVKYRSRHIELAAPMK